MGYVILRTNQSGGWVTRAGSRSSYTDKLQFARLFATREEAEENACDNEIVQELGEAAGR